MQERHRARSPRQLRDALAEDGRQAEAIVKEMSEGLPVHNRLRVNRRAGAEPA